MMDIERLAEVTTVQSFLSNYTVFMIPVNMMLCRVIAEAAGEARNRRLRQLLSQAYLIELLLCVLPLVFYRVLMRYLGQTHPGELVLLVICVATFGLFLVLRGITQGRQDFFTFGFSELLLYGIKLPVSLVLIYYGFGVSGCLAGIAAAQVLSSLYLLKKRGADGEKDVFRARRLPADRQIWINYAHILIMQVTISLLINNGEVLIANIYCDKREIGLYVVAAHLARILYYVIHILGTLLLPKIAAITGDADRQARMLRTVLGVAAAVSAVYAVMLFLTRGFLIRLLYGEAYLAAEGYIVPALGYSISLGFLFLYMQYLIATDRQRTSANIMLLTMAVMIILILVLRPDMRTMPWMLTAFILCNIGLIRCFAKRTEWADKNDTDTTGVS